jgi:hypothetical protein
MRVRTDKWSLLIIVTATQPYFSSNPRFETNDNRRWTDASHEQGDYLWCQLRYGEISQLARSIYQNVFGKL